MAKVSEEFTLSCVNISSFYKLPIALSGENHYLINEGRKSVVKVGDRKLLHSWTVKHPHTLTCPAVFHKKDEVIYCVMDNNVLLKWSIHDDILKKATKFKFQKNIFAVLPLQSHEPVVIFASGKTLGCEFLASNPEPIGEVIISKDEEIIWADASEEHSVVHIVCLALSKKTKKYQFHCFTVEESGVGNYYSQALENENLSLKNWCLNKKMHSFVTIWSNGQVLSHQLELQSESTLFCVPNVEEEHLLAIDSIDSNHIALVKSNPKLKESCLEIWDIKFKALKTRKILKISPSNSIQLCVVDSVIFLCHDEELMEISFHVEKSTLAAAVGKSLTTSPKLQEFSWKKGKLTQLPHRDQSVEKMDTSEIKQDQTNTVELIALRMMEEGPACLNYIPESELVRLLRYAIRCKVSLGEKSNVADVEPDMILKAIFSASFSDVFLVKFMKKLSLEDAMITLEILLSFLNHEGHSASDIPDKPSDLQLFNWICLVIQSHMEALLLSKNKKSIKLLRKLDRCLSEKMQEYEDYESIQHLFLLIQKKKNILPENYVIGKYCIETLDI